MDKEKLEKVIQRVNKLRALSKSDNPNEAAAAAAAAAKIIDEFRLSEAELEAGGQEAEPTQLQDDPLETSVGNVIAQWKQILANALCRHFGVYIVRDVNTIGVRKTRSKLTIAGRPSDVSVVRYFYAWLTVEIERLCKKDKPKGGGVAWCSTYKNGAAYGIDHQLKKMRGEERARQAGSQAMVLLDSRYDTGKGAYLAATGMSPDNIVTRKTGGWGSVAGAFEKGKEAGKNIHLGQHLGSGDGKLVSGNKLLR